MDISNKVRHLEQELEHKEHQLCVLEGIEDNMTSFQLSNPMQRVSIDIHKDDFRDDFIENKKYKINNRISIIEGKLDRIKDIINES